MGCAADPLKRNRAIQITAIRNNDDSLESETLHMTNGGGERLDRIEHILEQVAKSQEQMAKDYSDVAKDLAEAAKDIAEAGSTLREVVVVQREMAARQQYHDEAFERHDAEMKVIKEAIAADAENIRALARIAELHNRRLEDLDGGV